MRSAPLACAVFFACLSLAHGEEPQAKSAVPNPLAQGPSQAAPVKGVLPDPARLMPPPTAVVPEPNMVREVMNSVGALPGVVLMVIAIVVLLRYRRATLRRCLVGVAAGCAAPASLPMQGTLVGELASRLDVIEEKAAKAGDPKAAVEKIAPGLLALVASGSLDPFFALLEARSVTERPAYPALRTASGRKPTSSEAAAS